jgi:hypothetical protein
MIHSERRDGTCWPAAHLGQGGQDSEKPRMGRIEVDLLITGTGGPMHFQGNPAHAVRLLVIWGG